MRFIDEQMVYSHLLKIYRIVLLRVDCLLQLVKLGIQILFALLQTAQNPAVHMSALFFVGRGVQNLVAAACLCGKGNQQMRLFQCQKLGDGVAARTGNDHICCREQGCQTFNGLYMLLYQGAAAFTLWTGMELSLIHI